MLADAPTLQTESSDIGTVVSTKQIEDLPLALNSTGKVSCALRKRLSS